MRTSVRLLLPCRHLLVESSNRNTRTVCDIFSKLTVKIPEQRQRRRSGVFIFKFEHISHLVLVFPLTLN